MQKIKLAIGNGLFFLFSLLPLTNKVIGSSFYGMRYENNPRFVIEKLKEKCPDMKIRWIKDKKAHYELPQGIKPVTGKIQKIYEYATARVIIDSHFLPIYYKKRKGQLAIFMYHGGIGIKRNSNEVPSREKSKLPGHNAENMTFFVSNSTFVNEVIRGSLEFKGPILKCGYPKNDPLFDSPKNYKERVCNFYGIDTATKILMYAPTYRQDLGDSSGFGIDLVAACHALSQRFGGNWKAIVRWHPKQKMNADMTRKLYGSEVIDATEYGNMQELIISSDAFVSDYSSCIFDAAERKIPSFSFASDWETFRYEQGVHFEIDTLPFPYCRNNDELITAIKIFDMNKYLNELNSFLMQEGLSETGSASETIADIIQTYLSGNKSIINELKYEEI